MPLTLNRNAWKTLDAPAFSFCLWNGSKKSGTVTAILGFGFLALPCLWYALFYLPAKQMFSLTFIIGFIQGLRDNIIQCLKIYIRSN